MVDLGLSMARRILGGASARFLRDVAASVVATGLATAALSVAMHDGASQPGVDDARFDEQLVWQVEDVPTRDTRTYDSLAMFALPQVEPHAWSEAAVETTALNEASARPTTRTAAVPQHLAVTGTEHRRVSDTVLPPRRPVLLARMEPAPIAPRVGEDAPRVQRPVRLFGWSLPGGDLLPTSGQALQKVASLGTTAAAIGGDVADLGGALVDRIGLR